MYRTIATYLKTRYESKRHGGYDIYEDDKIVISYDTYYPNVDVYVKTPDGKTQNVLSRSGHGYDQEKHPGEWEKYCAEVLFPRALAAKKYYEKAQKEEKNKEYKERFKKVSPELDKVFTNEWRKTMKINPESMSVRKLPGNVYQHLEFVRQQQEAAPIVFFCLAGAALIVLAVALQSCGLAGGIR